MKAICENATIQNLILEISSPELVYIYYVVFITMYNKLVHTNNPWYFIRE